MGKVGEGLAAHATPRTWNQKLGVASVTTAPIASCGPCPLKDQGCYAQNGPLGWMVARMDRHVEEAGLDAVAIARAEADAIDALDTKLPLRLHQAGDCSTDETARIVSAAADRHRDWTGKPTWTYTHAWRAVARESWGGVSVLASCETPDEAVSARERGYAPALVVERFEKGQLPWKLDNGLTAVPCREQTGTATSCSDCRLCWTDGKLLERKQVIAFEIHGTQKSKATKAIALKIATQP
jgi:hypothetical protein